MNKKMRVLGVVFGVLLLLIVGIYIGHTIKKDTASNSSEDYPLLAKRLFLDNPNNTRINFSPLRKDLNTYFKENNIQGSIYFEYLPTGTSIRVNPDERYHASSLMKLPVAMELYKAAEKSLVNLDDTVQLKQEWLNNGFGTLYEKGVGYELTLREAAELLLAESDNTALRAILASTEGKLDTSELALGSLDIEFTLNSDDSIDIGTRSYSSFFKCLYFACYNTKEDSQEILTMLTKSPEKDRIVSGIGDKASTIAHKIGVFNTQIQSDCGIVYIENSNYALCVMLEGDDSQKTNEVFKALSEKVYNFVANQPS